jgi:hypothetical protein
VFLDVAVGPLWSLTGSLAAHKRGTALLTPRHAQGRAAAGAMDGSRGELQGRPAGSPNKHFSHLPLHLTELAGVPSSPQTPHLAGTAGRGGHSRWPPAHPPRRSSPSTTESRNGHLGVCNSPSAHARPVPADELAGFRRRPPPAAPRDPIAGSLIFSGGLVQTKGMCVSILKL